MSLEREYREFFVPIWSFIHEYEDTWHKPVTLVMLNRRFGIVAKKKFGVTLKTILVERPDDFGLHLAENGATLVVAKDV